MKQEFIKFLKSKRLWKRFKQDWTPMNKKETIEDFFDLYLNPNHAWESTIIDEAFCFDDTEKLVAKKNDFWCKVSTQWQDHLEGLKDA